MGTHKLLLFVFLPLNFLIQPAVIFRNRANTSVQAAVGGVLEPEFDRLQRLMVRQEGAVLYAHHLSKMGECVSGLSLPLMLVVQPQRTCRIMLHTLAKW